MVAPIVAPVVIPQVVPEVVPVVTEPASMSAPAFDPYPHLSHLLLEDDEEEVWWDTLKEGKLEGQDPHEIDQMLCVDPEELCVVTFIPKVGQKAKIKKEKIIEALQSLSELWGALNVRLFWTSIGDYPEAERELQINKS